MIYNRIPVMVGGLRKINLPPIMYQYDQVQKLILTDIELPESYRVDFCNDGDTRTITMVGTTDGVEIPNQLLQTGKPIKAFVVLSGTDENAVQTRIDINIPVNKRPPASDIAPTPAQQTTIDTLIEAMNTAVEDAETAEQGAKDAQQAIEDMTVSAETLAPGSAATVTKTIIEDVVHLLFAIPRGDKGAKGDPGTPGATGNGIASITLISTSGLNKTYRITYTNGNHFDYVVTDGEKGDTGNGIYSIYKTGTSGKVDTYTILFTDGNTTDFTVTNGTDGEDGVSPEVTITTITGGHRVTITDADHPSGQSFDVMDGTNTDADDVTYDPTETYTAGSVGAGLNQLNSDITAKPNIDLGITGASVGTFAKVKTVDESGKPTSWEYGSGGGGGGGTSDYTDLTNKPSINGVTLSGNKTAADLSLGTYTKPSSGIPDTDLSSAVQTSLGKADTALQSAPVTSVNTKTGAVVLDADDIEYDDSDAYKYGSVGYELSFLQNISDQLLISTTVSLTWEQGNISSAAGAEVTSTTRIRTGFVPLSIGLAILTIPTGYKAFIYMYSTDAASGHLGNAGGWKTGSYTLHPLAGTEYIRIVYANSSDSTIAPSSGSNILTEYAIVDATLTQTGKAADAKAVGDGLTAKITAPSSPSVGDFLVYTSNGWAAQSLSTWQGGNY